MQAAAFYRNVRSYTALLVERNENAGTKVHDMPMIAGFERADPFNRTGTGHMTSTWLRVTLGSIVADGRD